MSTEPTAGIRPGNISFIIDGEVPNTVRTFLISMALVFVGWAYFGCWGTILGFIPLYTLVLN